VESAVLNLRHLRAVVATVATGSISAAAQQVNVTQPALTQGIARLETQIGIPLFERRPRGMEPTDAARILAPRAAAALALVGSPRVTAPQMRAFAALGRCGSYAGAAQETGMREASLHRAVADLAVGLGARLVERRGRGIGFTPRGAVVARRFRLAEVELRTALGEIETLKGREVGRIAVGGMPLCRARLLPNAIAAFHQEHPLVDVRIVEGSFVELAGPLRDGDIDFMLGAIRNGPEAADLVQWPLFHDRLVILGRARHPLLAVKRAITPEQLAGYPWVMPPEGAPLRAHWREMFLRSGVEPPRVAIESGSVIVARQLLTRGDYLTLLSPDQVAVELKAGWLARIADAPGDPARLMGVVTRGGWNPTRLQQRLLDLLADEAKLIEARQP
jgi:DNA-binding transcriptional LysR family regulator